MVCLRLVGGCLSIEKDNTAFDARLAEAARLFAHGDYGAAAACYQEILGVSSNHPDALHMLGVIAQRANKTELALALFEQALAAQPVFPLAQFNRAVILRLLGRDDEAMMSVQMALDNDASLAAGWDLKGQIHKDRDEREQAADCYKRAIDLDSGNANFYNNYGALLLSQGDVNAAYQAAQQVERIDTNFPPLLSGNILLAMGYPEKAAEKFARVRATQPQRSEGSISEAMARLQIGDMEQGWTLWEMRPDLIPEHEAALKKIEVWQGQKVSHLVLYEDQGLGDAIQFLRYMPLVKNLADKITLHVREPLRRLCAENFPFVEISNGPVVQGNARCRLSSLPFHFSARLNNIASAPYLSSGKKIAKDKLQIVPCPRIGLVWAGNANFRNDAKRSLVASLLEPLLATGRDHFVSLQKDKTSKGPNIFDPTADIHDFADTAAWIDSLDLVISVDTATAHLAGAMGKPVWILVPFVSDWRWFLGRFDSPWYKNARLFRQTKPDDWRGVIEIVAGEVEKLLSGNKSVLMPTPWQGENLRQNPNALILPS